METPLYNKLIKYHNQNRISFSMPGHKGNINKSLINLDVTELSKTADLHSESDEVKEANKLLSRLYKSDRSFILTSGSTTAIWAMIASALKPHETLLVPSDCHMSVINACTAMDINLRICDKEFDNEFLIPSRGINVKKYLDAFPDIRAVLITSPNYYGQCVDIKEISQICHSKKLPLLVDEAHGAHFIASDRFPTNSVLYADLVCHSAHKTLNALTGAAYLHVKNGIISHTRVRQCINMFESSSPSYPIAASADIARFELENSSHEWDKAVNQCREFSKKLNTIGLDTLKNDDPTRLVINFNGFKISGYDVDKHLANNGIDIEMSDLKNIVLIVTTKNTDSDFNMLFNALYEIVSKCEKEYSNITFTVPCHENIICPQKVFFKNSTLVPLKDSLNHISRVTVTAYPPGTPVIIAGEKITEGHINSISVLTKSGARITGLDNGKIEITTE